MTILNSREHELVAIGAAVASNCIPCIEHHIEAARKAGLTDTELAAAVELADSIKRVPAGKVLEAASLKLSAQADCSAFARCSASANTKSCC